MKGLSPIESPQPRTGPQQFSGIRFDLLGFIFHLSWMYLFLYVEQPAGAADTFSAVNANMPVSTSPTLLYATSVLALVTTLASFAIAPSKLLLCAQSKTASIGAPAITALGTLLYCLAYYTAIGTDIVAVAAGILTGIGSGFLAERWVHTFESAGVAGTLGSTPSILAGIIAICITTPYLPLYAGIVLVVILPLLSGFCAARADTGAQPVEKSPDSTNQPNEKATYTACSVCIAALGIILGYLNSSIDSPLFAEYLSIFFLTATVAVLAASAMFIFKNQRSGFVFTMIVPLCIVGCLTVLFMQVNQANFFDSFIPIGSVCLEMLFLMTLVVLAQRFGFPAVRVFAVGRITYAISNLAGSTVGQHLIASKEALATVQTTSFMLFAGIELITVATVLVLILSRRGGAASATDLEAEPAAMVDSKLKRFAAAYRLSARETDVASHLVKGRGYARIQQELHIAEGTVNYHTRNIYAKTDVHTREDLIDLFDSFE